AQLLLQMRDQRAHIGIVAATRTPHRIEPHLLALEERGLTRNVHRHDREKTHGERSEDAARDLLSADRHFSLPFRTRMRPDRRHSKPAPVHCQRRCDPRSGFGLVGLKPQATQDGHAVASSTPRLPPWAALSFAATARRSILPAPLSGSAATMSTKRGCE